MKKLICHCGAVEAEINLDGDLAKVIKCNCSICKRKGAIMSMVKNEDFKIIKGKKYELNRAIRQTLFFPNLYSNWQLPILIHYLR